MITGQMCVMAPAGWLKQPEAALSRTLDSLPASAAHLRQEHNLLLAHIMTQLAAMVAENRRGTVPRRFPLRCLALDPSGWRNLGLVKIVANGGRHLRPIPLEKIP